MTELVLLSRVEFRGRQINGARLIGLLAMLARDLRTGCGLVRLVDGLWRDKRPENPINAVQVLVSRARSQLGPGVIVNTSTGYRLALSETDVDVSVVVSSASDAARHSRNGDHATALMHAKVGLAFWAEPPSIEPGEDALSVLRAERADTYQSLIRIHALSLSPEPLRRSALGAVSFGRRPSAR
ncbi:hypothetical protein LWC34_08965 [Kibdelosporangium philippinense]|uniref:OmpR/PhoB-type domain-containing protein n=1 Tax=Kibdelosporangium philippinense TaxID=211113 RepID=A0ABS8Z8S6_9PSEU|nr:hypothetical protein [Kibdelosporangium philippinense]MCE7002958.1 hypothetical protein [Kibdelosporangium philippinense]